MTPSNESKQDANPDDGGTPSNKVARLIKTYDLGEGYGGRLEQLWTADGEERESLRSLADRFNRRLLAAAMTEAGESPLDGELDNLYRLLTDEDVSSGNRTEARKRLEQAGVDAEQLETDFVSYQAIRSYLKEYRGADYEQDDDTTSVERVIERVQRLESRTRSVARKGLATLRNNDQIALDEFRVFVTVEVMCERCGRQSGLVELLRAGGCECRAE